LLLGDIATSPRKGRKNVLNWTIFNTLGIGTAVVRHEEHLPAVAKVPVPPESTPIAEGDLEPDEITGLSRSGRRAGFYVVRGEISKVRVENFGVLEGRIDLKRTDLAGTDKRRAFVVMPGPPTIGH